MPIRNCLASVIVFALVFTGNAASGETVTNLDDSGPGSLRQAIRDVADGGTIEIGVMGEIVLTGGQLSIDRPMTIDGPGARSLTISGNNESRVVRVVRGDVVISGVTLADGAISGFGGGAVWNLGNLTLDGVVVRDSRAEFGGGGLRNDGRMLLIRCTVRDNLADHAFGGGIDNVFGGDLEIRDSTISGNVTRDGPGAGVSNFSSSTVLVVNSTIAGNTASWLGGGLHSDSELPITIKNTIVSGNTSATSSTQDCMLWSGSPWISLGFNLFGQGTGCPAVRPTDLTTDEPQLAPLALNGGATQTHALLTSSIAIDAGSCRESSSDQRGVPRPFDFLSTPDADDGCDIGAFEFRELGAAPIPGRARGSAPSSYCAHDPCQGGAALDPDCDPCVAAVCAADPFCCATQWDATCVSAAGSCGLGCP
jgi:hypothetical protein